MSTSDSFHYRDFGIPGDVKWMVTGHKDGHVRYCTNAWTEGGKTRLSFRDGRSPLCIPLLFDTEEEAKNWVRRWQRSFPADSTGWGVEVSSFEV